MTLADVKAGTKLEIEIIYPDGASSAKMVSQIEAVQDERKALIAVPMLEGIYHSLKKGTRLVAFFLVNIDIYRIELYFFNAVVVKRVHDEKIPVLLVELTGEIGKVQRREYYRTECSLDIKYSLVKIDSEGREKPENYKNTITRNLSGGGVCILAKEKIHVRSMVKCMLSLKGKKISFRGKVVRVSPYEKQGIYNYEYGITFTEIKDSNREDIIRFIFREQRRMRQKGLI